MIQKKELPYIVKVPCDQKYGVNRLRDFFSKEKIWLEKILRTYGAILFRGSKIIPEIYYNLLEELNFEFTTYVGGDSPRTKLSSKVYTSTEYPSDQEIILHNELSFSNTYPRYLFFYCALPAKAGGETPLADARILYKQLPGELIQKYKEKKLKYTMNLHDGIGLGKSWQQVFETTNKTIVENILKKRKVDFYWKKNGILCLSEVVQPVINHPVTNDTIFFSQAHQWHSSNLDKQVQEALFKLMPEKEFYHYVSYADDQPLELKDLELTKKTINEIKVVFNWQVGDLLFIDNLLIMHGRNPYKGDRKILLSMANNWQ